MARVAKRLAGGGETNKAQFIGNSLEARSLRLEEAKLAVSAGVLAREGVFHDRRQSGVGHDITARAAPHKLVDQQAEGIGVALKVGDVLPNGVAHLAAQRRAGTLGEVGLDGLLARMAEGWVTHVVGEARRLHNRSYLLKQRAAKLRVLVRQAARHVVAQRLAQRRHFQRVGKAVVDEDAARKGKHLRLVLQATERG